MQLEPHSDYDMAYTFTIFLQIISLGSTEGLALSVALNASQVFQASITLGDIDHGMFRHTYTGDVLSEQACGS